MDHSEVEKLYAWYEAKLGVTMTKALGRSALLIYSGLAGMLLLIPTEKQPDLVADLKTNTFIRHALSSIICKLYHYGMLLVPLTIALTTMRHCQFGGQHPQIIDGDDGRSTRHSVATIWTPPILVILILVVNLVKLVTRSCGWLCPVVGLRVILSW